MLTNSAVAIAASAASAAVWTAPSAFAYAPSPIHRVIGAHRRLRSVSSAALTFDDGPQPEATDAILAALAELHITATFFVVGEQVVRAPNLVREIVAEGHELGCHGDVHRNHLLRSPVGLGEDLRRGRARLEDVVGSTIDLYRPPQGSLTWPSLRSVRAAGMALVLWSAWARDWERSSTASRVERLATRRLRGGDVVLLHDADTYARRDGTWRDTVAALPGIARVADQRGLTLGSIGGRANLA